MSSTPGKRTRARAQLIDQLEERLLRLKPLSKILKAVGFDSEGADAKRLVSYMLAGLYHGIQRMEKEQAHRTVNRTTRWTTLDDMKLLLEIKWRKREHGSEHEAVRSIATDPTYRTPYKRQTGRKTPKVDDQTLYEQALWRRWMVINKRQREWEEEFKALGLSAYDPFPAKLLRHTLQHSEDVLAGET